MNTHRLWHIFCKVIDNYGDIGVCWRLSCDLASRGEQVVLWVDDPSALAWMAPNGWPGGVGHGASVPKDQGEVTVRVWPNLIQRPEFSDSNIIIESFGCEINPEFIAYYADSMRTNCKYESSWINLEYISAENYAETHHGLPSPVMSGPGKGLTKRFFYPGFTPRTGGLLRERDLLQRQAAFDRAGWLKSQGISWKGERKGERLVSLFCYEPKALGALLAQLANGPTPVKLLVTHGRARAAIESWMAGRTGRASTPMIRGQLTFCYLPALTQLQYDELLWACDLNFVRGEDSLVRACLSGKPFVWHIYPQDDDAHHAKLEAFLQVLGAAAAPGDSLAAFHRVWNGLAPKGTALPELDLANWGEIASQARKRWLGQTDLTTQLLQFVAKKR